MSTKLDILDGKKGETLAKVMETMVRYGQLFDATSMVKITSKYNHLVTSFGLKGLASIYDLLDKENIRVKLDDRNEKLSYKMRESQTKKVPLTLVLGDNEKDNNQISYREYGKQETITCSIDEFISKVNDCIKNKEQNL